jgi:hypothetical protein
MFYKKYSCTDATGTYEDFCWNGSFKGHYQCQSTWDPVARKYVNPHCESGIGGYICSPGEPCVGGACQKSSCFSEEFGNSGITHKFFNTGNSKCTNSTGSYFSHCNGPNELDYTSCEGSLCVYSPLMLSQGYVESTGFTCEGGALRKESLFCNASESIPYEQVTVTGVLSPIYYKCSDSFGDHTAAGCNQTSTPGVWFLKFGYDCVGAFFNQSDTPKYSWCQEIWPVSATCTGTSTTVTTSTVTTTVPSTSTTVTSNQSGTGDMVSIPARMDTFADMANQSATHGSDTTFAVGTSPPGYSQERQSYLSFDISTLDAKVASAQLYLYEDGYIPPSFVSLGGMDVCYTTEGWDESTLSWNAKPFCLAVFANATVPSVTGWVTVNVTGLVNFKIGGNADVMSMILKAANEKTGGYRYARFSSRDTIVNQPYLLITR